MYTPLRYKYMVSPCPHSRDSAKSKHRRVRVQAPLCSSPPADFFSSFVLFAMFPCFLHPPAQHQRLSLPPRRRHSLLRSLFCAAFLFSASPLPRLHAKANTTLIYLPVSAGTRVIYCDLIAFNSSGATVNHRASRIARVRHACCRYDVITFICESAMRMRMAITIPHSAR